MDRPSRIVDWLRTVPGDPRLYAWLGLLMAMACVLKAITSKSMLNWVSSDTLWPVDLFIDSFRDGYSFHHWEFSIAPCWFPDIALVGICYFVLRNPILTTLIAGLVQFVILLAGFCLCWRALRLANLKLLDILTIGSGIASAVWISFHSDMLHPGFWELLVPQSHVGNLIMHVFAIWLTLLMIRSAPGAKTRTTSIAFALVCAAAGLSNLMFFPHTLLPLSISLGLLAFARILPVRQAVLPILLGWPSAVAGAAAYRFFFTAMNMGAQASVGFEVWRTAARTFFAGASEALANIDLQHLAAVAWLPACVVVGFTLLWRLRGSAENSSQRPHAGVALFFLTSAGASIFGPATMILGGSNGLTTLHDYYWTMHYMHPTFLFPLFAWPSLLGLLPEVRLSALPARALAFAGAMTCLIAPAIAFEQIPRPPVLPWNYVPEYVRLLDQNARQYGLKYGIAGYWQARMITLLSKTGLRAYPIDGMIRPFYIVSNQDWFVSSVEDRAKKPCFSFIVLNDPLWKISRNEAVAAAGEPSYEVNAWGIPVLIYAKGTPGHATPRCIAFAPHWGTPIPEMDWPLFAYTSAMSSTVNAFAANPSERINVPIRVMNRSAKAWSSIGRFPVNLSYRWLKDGKILPIEGERTSLPGALAPGTDVSLSAVVVAPQKPGTYTLRMSLVQEGVTWFYQRGNLWLDIPAVVEPAPAAKELPR
jgi:hypothetical protein